MLVGLGIGCAVFVLNVLRAQVGGARRDVARVRSEQRSPPRDAPPSQGRVWSRAELRHVAAACARQGVLLVADEIWADWVLPVAAPAWTSCSCPILNPLSIPQRA